MTPNPLLRVAAIGHEAWRSSLFSLAFNSHCLESGWFLRQRAFTATSHLSGEHAEHEVRIEPLSAGRRLLCSQNTPDGPGRKHSPALSSFALCSGYMGPNRACQSVWLKKLLFWTWLDLGVSLVLLASTWTGLGQMWHMLCCSPCPRSLLCPVFGLPMSSKSSAEMFRTGFGHCYVHLASISLQMTKYFVSGLKGMMKMFKKWKKKKKEKKELKKRNKEMLT